ncbi:MAG: DUF2063 domain-containing protein [Acidobacteria bacterium]|nr:MAG: DUF2063 domain-containing protein [Acidobacteriota bacterium]
MSDPPPLDALEAWMQSALIRPQRRTGEEAARIIEPSPQLSPAQRLAIYQRGYYLRLLKCMEEQFPALRHALGDELFRDFARQYLEARPPERYTLYDLGRRFPAYLEETRPDAEKAVGDREPWIDFMVDLARFERRLFVMFDAPGNEGKPFATAADADGRLRLQPCFALGEYRFPVETYYLRVRQGDDPPLPPCRRSLVALVRKDYRTRVFPLTPAHYLFLAALRKGESVGEALARVARQTSTPHDEVERSWSAPGGIRRRWIEAGFFVAAG